MEIFSLQIDDINIAEATHLLESSSGFSFVVTPNIQHVVAVNRDSELLDMYKQANLILCDSRIFQKVCTFASKKIANVVAGSDLTKFYFENYFNGDEEVMVIGSSDSDIDLLRSDYGMKNLSHYNPPMGFINCPKEITRTIHKIQEFKPRYVFLAVGFPRQEILACRLKEVIDFDCTAFCIGASIDFLTGKQNRAPERWQAMRMEWLYRFIQEPRRLFKRYFIDSLGLIPLLIREYKKSD